MNIFISHNNTKLTTNINIYIYIQNYLKTFIYFVISSTKILKLYLSNTISNNLVL